MHAWEQIQKTLEFIEAHLSEEISIDSLAKMAALLPFYYQRLFSRLVKKPVAEYIKLRRMARANNIYYPDGDSHRAWIRWTTPSTPQNMTINVSVNGGGSASKATINVKIVDLDQNPPPNPVADDRNDDFTSPSITGKPQKISASWSIWRPWWQEHWVWVSDWDYCDHGEDGGHWVDNGWWEDQGWWEFDNDQYSASLSASMSIKPDEKSPTASGKTLKSGYGFNQTVTANVSTNLSSAVTGAQNAVTYFPEFQYQTYWRLLERMSSGYSSRFEFKVNQYSVVAYKTSRQQTVSLVLDTVRAAMQKEAVAGELQLHSDQGFQYTSQAYFTLTKESHSPPPEGLRRWGSRPTESAPAAYPPA